MSVVHYETRLFYRSTSHRSGHKRGHKGLSRHEWKHRLAGYGFNIRGTGVGDMLETLPHRVEVYMLPA